MNFATAIINIIDHLPWMQGAPSDGVEDQPREDHPGTTFLDGPECGPAARSHGTFDSVASSSSTVSSKSDDSFVTSLEEAEDAHLTTEEAVKYLKNVLGIEKNPTDGTSLKTPNGDAQGEMTVVTHGQPWITVIRHRIMRVKAEQGWRGASMPKLAGRTRLIQRQAPRELFLDRPQHDETKRQEEEQDAKDEQEKLQEGRKNVSLFGPCQWLPYEWHATPPSGATGQTRYPGVHHCP
jgi:hypothetical protein